MLRFSIILFLVIAGYSYQAQALSVSVTGDKDRGDCPYADGKVTITVTNLPSTPTSNTMDLEIHCASLTQDPDNPYGTKDNRWTGKANITNGEVEHEVTLSDTTVPIQVKDKCEARAKVTGTDGNNGGISDEFTIAYKQIGGWPELQVEGSSGITGGKEFKISNFSVNDEVPFYDLLLRECTAAHDPWMFWREDKGNGDSDLHRVYPTSTTNSEQKAIPLDKDTDNDNACLGAFDGELKLVTIGADHSGCRIKVVKEGVNGDNFTEQGAPHLSAAAEVTVSNGKVMVHTGAKPEGKYGDAIEVYVSTNRGATWQRSTMIMNWTSQSDDSGIPAAASSSDNTRNMAVIRIINALDSDGPVNEAAWYRLIKGKAPAAM